MATNDKLQGFKLRHIYEWLKFAFFFPNFWFDSAKESYKRLIIIALLVIPILLFGFIKGLMIFICFGLWRMTYHLLISIYIMKHGGANRGK